jgi:ribonuclease PH
VIMTAAGGFVEIQGTAEQEAFSPEELTAMLALAKEGIAELCEKQQAALNE